MGDIEIKDIPGFPGKVTKIKQASVNLRGYADELGTIVAEAKREAASFTTGGEAPIYAEIIKALENWHTGAKAAISSVCDSADNCVATMTDKYTKITGADIDTSTIIRKL